MKPSSTCTHWLSSQPPAVVAVDCLCIGTGRFLRSVLVPALEGVLHPILIQTRGRSFLEFMQQQSAPKYPVDTVLASGDIQTDWIPCFGAFSWGQPADKRAFEDWLKQQPSLEKLKLIGVGVTEAGLASAETQVMKDMAHFLKLLAQQMLATSTAPLSKITIVNTDNVPNNGAVLKSHMKTLVLENDKDTTTWQFVQDHVVFLDSMVDRITSQRPGQPLIPRAEPLPAKALVWLDPHHDLPPVLAQRPGVVVRASQAQLQQDLDWKLRIANGTHTAIAHALALLGWTQTTALAATTMTTTNSKEEDSKNGLFMSYLDALVQNQILAALDNDAAGAKAVWDDWRQRLTHPHFGLSSFFITQNGPAKGGIRLGPTVRDLVAQKKAPLTVAMALAYCILLRWLTPQQRDGEATALSARDGDVFHGWMQGGSPKATKHNDSDDAVEYADGLCYNLKSKWYTFRCNCLVQGDDDSQRNLSEWLGQTAATTTQTPQVFHPVIRAYMNAPSGGNLADAECTDLIAAIAVLYSRLLAGTDLMELFEDIHYCKGIFTNGWSTLCASLASSSYK